MYALALVITLQRGCQSVNDEPGSWNSITRSMSKKEIERLKKMAIPSYSHIIDQSSSKASPPFILESANAGTKTANPPIFVGSSQTGRQEEVCVGEKNKPLLRFFLTL